jgi:hypothetical protein
MLAGAAQYWAWSLLGRFGIGECRMFGAFWKSI